MKEKCVSWRGSSFHHISSQPRHEASQCRYYSTEFYPKSKSWFWESELDVICCVTIQKLIFSRPSLHSPSCLITSSRSHSPLNSSISQVSRLIQSNTCLISACLWQNYITLHQHSQHGRVEKVNNAFYNCYVGFMPPLPLYSVCDHVWLIWMSPVPCPLVTRPDSHTGVTVPGFISPQAWQWSDCECGHETLSKPGLATLFYIVCCKLVICVFVISLYLICLCSGRGSSADAALVSLHQILLQQPRRLAEA